ncbi:MAG TPA: type II toxin-antitoxin system VapC family toxin [Acetobacteraceae bacterium]|nr:type II toxin-antitoxin system VapC family toxin [Acetobacteraceae bacterium]
MNLLLDTHLLLWAAVEPNRLPRRARELLEDAQHRLMFSVASIWEIAIKRGLERPDFLLQPGPFRRDLLENGYVEIPITGEHTVATMTLPPLHKDPFDRILVAQAATEGYTLLTSDPKVAAYPGPIQYLR